MALNESRISQKIADDSNRVANDSKYLTAAAKKDSSAMLGIALLTMVFLPPTFVSVSSPSANSYVSKSCLSDINQSIDPFRSPYVRLAGGCGPKGCVQQILGLLGYYSAVDHACSGGILFLDAGCKVWKAFQERERREK